MISAIILAGGSGSRMKNSLPKQLLPLAGKLVLHHSVEFFLKATFVHEVIVVLAQEYRIHCPYPKVVFAEPGLRRQDSLANGFTKLSSGSSYILVHDAARPLMRFEDVQALVEEGKKVGAATLAVPATSTMREADLQGIVTRTPRRDSIWEIQTPQFLTRELLEKGLNKAQLEAIEVTDDVGLAELLDHKIQLVKGSASNFKITMEGDLERAAKLLQ
jgi:2-C-methyl-D-erythritol 4-phosphate cytidylyltransferase